MARLTMILGVCALLVGTSAEASAQDAPGAATAHTSPSQPAPAPEQASLDSARSISTAMFVTGALLLAAGIAAVVATVLTYHPPAVVSAGSSRVDESAVGIVSGSAIGLLGVAGLVVGVIFRTEANRLERRARRGQVTWTVGPSFEGLNLGVAGTF